MSLELGVWDLAFCPVVHPKSQSANMGEFHHASGALLKNPGLTAVATLTLALGIGATNAAIFA